MSVKEVTDIAPLGLDEPTKYWAVMYVDGVWAWASERGRDGMYLTPSEELARSFIKEPTTVGPDGPQVAICLTMTAALEIARLEGHQYLSIEVAFDEWQDVPV